MVAMSDEQYRIAVLRALAYLIAHPEIGSGLEWTRAADSRIPSNRIRWEIAVEAAPFWRTVTQLREQLGIPEADSRRGTM